MENIRKEALSAQISALANENEAFVKDLVTADSPAAVQAALKKYGVDATIAEVEDMYADGVKVINDYLDSADSELGEADLEDVAGGGFVRFNFGVETNRISACGYGCLCSSRTQTCGENPTVTRTVSARAGLRIARRY